jgi:hypothetical protein
MRNKRILIILVVIGLLVGLTTSVYATSSYHPATPNIVGVWHTSIKIEGMPEGFQGLYTFSADGNFLDTNSFKETNPGVWIGSGNTYLVTFWGFLFDEQGQANGKARVSASIRMDDADHFTAHGVTDTFDLDGQAMENQFAGPFEFEGVRMEVELPYTEAAP